ncbi:ABC transporter [Ochromonadaceae sp. CCMP2298]|nr:ABC transporter [Ochromonadaceae sp. CCMP2298]|mmetsp:Transcript_4492/g.9868  ORF Transcript_4492/g.9868 Transcript_4492/m.9868 type:complete len:651 (+) Transcript_4492:193-2145(+)
MSTKAIGVDFDGGFDGGGGGSTKSSSKGLCPCGCDHPLSKGQHRCLHSAESFHENNKAKVEYQSINKSRKSAAAPSFEWKRINFKVGEKKILDDCWGRVTAGTVCAILGPSGAGKSSLLNVLAGRSANAPGVTISAAVRVDGQLINPVSFRKNIAYVMQDDSLMATATPREALTFSAKMRLPSTVTAAKIDEKVVLLLAELGLTGCCDVMIGGAMIKGISGGQRKRTSVGVELVTDPGLVFLDEPTSGLDSFSAFSLITLMKRVAGFGCTVLLTIHQPSSETFVLFDTVIFMKAGRIVYHDAVPTIKPYFTKCGYHCPENYNPADFVMSLIQLEDARTLQQRGVYMPVHPSLDNFDEQNVQLNGTVVDFGVEHSFLVQLYALTMREVINVRRDTGALIGRFLISGFLNMLFGIVFLGAGGRDNGNDEDFNAHFGAIAFVLISGMFASAQATLMAFPFERPMFLREYSTGTYAVAPYFISKLLLEIPLNFIQVVYVLCILYWSMDLQGSFIFIVMALFGLFMACNSVAVVLGSAIKDVKTGTELVPLLFVPQILFAGFFIRTSQIPVFLRWAQWLCSLKYAVNLVLLTEFNAGNESCKTSEAAANNCRQLLKDNNIEPDQYFVSIIILAALFAGLRVVGPMILAQRAKRYY